MVAEELDVRFVSASVTPGVKEKSGARVGAPQAWGFRFTAKGRKVSGQAGITPAWLYFSSAVFLCRLKWTPLYVLILREARWV